MTFLAGQTLTAADLAPLTGVWTSYAPTWTAETVNPAIGDGTITGRYRQVGKTIDVYIHIAMGSTTTYGTGRWALTLPVAALLDTALGGFARDNAPAGLPVACQVQASGHIFRMYTASGAITSTVPWTWATSDSLTISGTYEVA